ncbi:MAG: sigma 54-interacting transcriptional regulator [Desulfatiglandales bacterium]
MSENDTNLENGLLSFDPSKHQPDLLRAWETFIKSGIIEKETVPSHIAESWIRSRAYKIDPHDFSPHSYLPNDEYKKRIINNEPLIEITRPIMENVYNSLEQTRYLVVLYDSDGYHLLRMGQRTDFQRSSKFKVREGLCFDENHVGTSGFSLAKWLQRPIQITGCEHYSALLHYVTGAYAPIFSSRTKELIGVIGVGGAQTIPNLHTLGIAIAASTAIGNLLELNQAKGELFIYSKSLQIAIDSFEDAVILVDKRCQIYEINQAAKRALRLENGDIKGRHIAELRDFSPLKDAVMRAFEFEDREGKEIECEIHNQIFLASIKFVGKNQHDAQGVMVQLKNVRNLSRMLQNLTGDKPKYTIENMVGSSEKMREIKNVANIVARSNAPVIIEGESGTGKDVLAQAIHNASYRKGKPFIPINCSAIPSELLESILFGHEKGAFTGATGTHIGKFELANGGTLFFDEIAEMSLGMQVKILRVIEEGITERVGGKKPFPIDVRILAATNKDLYHQVQNRLFRTDLFYRLNVFRILLPPLRERKEDILDLFYTFVADFASRSQRSVPGVSDEYLDLLLKYDWPGNIRELRNSVQYSMARLDSDTLLPSHLKGFFLHPHNHVPDPSNDRGPEKLTDIQKQVILKALESHQGNKAETARVLGISRATLYRKLKAIS